MARPRSLSYFRRARFRSRRTFRTMSLASPADAAAAAIILAHAASATPDGARPLPTSSAEDDGAVPVDENPILEMRAHGGREDGALEIAPLAHEVGDRV